MSASLPLPTTDLRPSEHARALHERLVAVWAVRQSSEHEAATLLVAIADASAHVELGYTTIAAYAAHVLDLTKRQARDFLRIGRALPGLPVLDRAFAEGRLAWTKVRELVRVVEPDTEAAWVERAEGLGGHDLERLVSSADRGEPPPTRAGRLPERKRLVFETETADAETIRDAIAWMRASAGVGDEVDDGALLAMMLKRRIHDARQEEVAGHRTPPSLEPYRVVIQHCEDCGSAHGGDHEISDTLALEAACDAEVVEMDGEHRGRATHTVPPKVRRTVLIRDGHCCRVPGCTNRNWVHAHHIESRVFGGPSTEGNVVTCCDAHHRWVHSGRLGVEVERGELVFRFSDGRVVRSALDPRGSPARAGAHRPEGAPARP